MPSSLCSLAISPSLWQTEHVQVAVLTGWQEAQLLFAPPCQVGKTCGYEAPVQVVVVRWQVEHCPAK